MESNLVLKVNNLKTYFYLDEGRELKNRVKDLVKIVGLNIKHLKRYPHAFSGGQRQRIWIGKYETIFNTSLHSVESSFCHLAAEKLHGQDSGGSRRSSYDRWCI